MRLGVEKAARHGVAVIALRNSGHLGRIGDWPAQAAAASASTADAKLNEIRAHFDRYKQLVAQGKLADAGKELEAIEAEVK